MKQRPNEPLPEINRWLLWAFTCYTRRNVRRHFHSLRLLQGADPPTATRRGLLIYMNHPSWWDPSIVVLMADRFFPACRHYSVFAEAALNDYAFFRRIGAIGVDPDSSASVRRFLRIGRNVLSSPKQVFWMTPQGAFRDARERPASLKPGLELLARRSPGFDFLPMAIEYPFWDEKFPEALLAFGQTTPSEAIADRGVGLLVDSLTRLQDRLAEGAKSRDAKMFRSLEIGSFGVGGVYDYWRRFSNWWRGRSFSTRHGEAP